MQGTLRIAAAAAIALIGCALAGCAGTPGRAWPLWRVMATACSADGQTLAASTVSDEVALFDIAPLRFRTMLAPGAEPAVEAPRARQPPGPGSYRSPPLAFSPDGKLLVGAGIAGYVVGWDADSGRVRFRTPLAGEAADVAFHPDGRSFLVVGPAASRFSADNGSLLGELKPPDQARFSAVAVSADGKHVFAGLSTGEIAQYDAEAGSMVRLIKGHAVPVTGVAVAPDGSSFASTAGQFDPKLWNLGVDPPLPLRISELQSTGKSLYEAGDAVVEAAGGLLILHRLLLGTLAISMIAPPAGLAGLIPLAEAGAWASAMANRPPLLEQAAMAPGNYCGTRIAYSPDGRFVATTAEVPVVSGLFRLVLADVVRKNARVISAIEGCSVAFSSDSRFVITGGTGAPRIWNAETGQQVGGAR